MLSSHTHLHALKMYKKERTVAMRHQLNEVCCRAVFSLHLKNLTWLVPILVGYSGSCSCFITGKLTPDPLELLFKLTGELLPELTIVLRFVCTSAAKLKIFAQQKKKLCITIIL